MMRGGLASPGRDANHSPPINIQRSRLCLCMISVSWDTRARLFIWEAAFPKHSPTVNPLLSLLLSYSKCKKAKTCRISRARPEGGHKVNALHLNSSAGESTPAAKANTRKIGRTVSQTTSKPLPTRDADVRGKHQQITSYVKRLVLYSACCSFCWVHISVFCPFRFTRESHSELNSPRDRSGSVCHAFFFKPLSTCQGQMHRPKSCRYDHICAGVCLLSLGFNKNESVPGFQVLLPLRLIRDAWKDLINQVTVSPPPGAWNKAHLSNPPLRDWDIGKRWVEVRPIHPSTTINNKGPVFTSWHTYHISMTYSG